MTVMSTSQRLRRDCSRRVQPQPEIHGRRLSDNASAALPMPSMTQIEAVVWIRRQTLYGAASRDTMGRDHAEIGRAHV